MSSPTAELSQAALQALGFCLYHSHVVSGVPGTFIYMFYTSFVSDVFKFCGNIIAAEGDFILFVFQKPLQQNYYQHFVPWWGSRQIRTHAPEHYGSSPNRAFLQMWLAKM